MFRLLLFAPFLCFVSCASVKNTPFAHTKKVQKQVEKSPVFNKAFTGFVLLDPVSNKVLCDVNGEKYFTPASNTKILTLYTCLNVLGDTMPGVKYVMDDDYLVLRGTGDPTFGHPKFVAWQKNLDFFKGNNKKSLQINNDNWRERPLGPGWAWDDASEYYAAERSALPFHGNVFKVKKGKNDLLEVAPLGLNWTTVVTTEKNAPDFQLLQNQSQNILKIQKKAIFPNSFEAEVPVRDVEANYFPLLLNALGKPPLDLEGNAPVPQKDQWRTLYSCPSDTVYRRMMYQSDNFIAEQLLLSCAGVKFDTLDQSLILKWAKDSLFVSLPQPLKWVDGSGLSRYNMNTPRNNAEILRLLWGKVPQQSRLFSYFPAGGVSGTLKNWYAGTDGKPYVFAKTGSMGGVHCLSGYVLCKSGKVLVFSFMHNNFLGSSNDWKSEMQRILLMVRDEN